ncbi:MAG: response regulator [Candidatus Goldiibacteriota bacterium]
MDRKKILAVDDEPNILAAVKETLDDTYLVITARTGKEALKAIDAQEPDLVIMDVMMPEMDGFEAVKALRAKRPPSHPPVIFLSARTALADVEEGLKIGGFDYITKPFSPTKLLKKVEDVFERMEIRKKIQQQKKK